MMALLLYDDMEDWNRWQNKKKAQSPSDFVELHEIEPVFLTSFLSTCHWTQIELMQVHAELCCQSAVQG